MPFKSSSRGAYGPQGQKVIKGPLAPVWVTSGTLTTATSSSYSVQLSATDDSGDSPTYSLASGSIPPGITLSSSGLLSGTATGASTTYTFTVRATDVNGRFTDSSTLSLPVSLVSISSTMAAAIGSSTSFSTSTQGYYTEIDFRGLPAQGFTYRFTLKGGNGGNTSGGNRGGYGAYLQVDVPDSALANKIVAFVCAGNGADNPAGRASSGGGGFSGVIQMAALGTYQCITHIASAAGGGGSSGPGDNGTGDQGIDSTSIVYSGNPSAGLGGLAKRQNGQTGRYPTINYAARPGNAYGGGDGPSDEDTQDNFANGGGGGFGPLAGGFSNNASGPGIRGGNASANPYAGGAINLGGFGGGGASSNGGSGSVTWRVCSGAGAGGGFQGGQGGDYTTDGNAAPGGAGVSAIINGTQVSFSGANSGQPSFAFTRL